MKIKLFKKIVLILSITTSIQLQAAPGDTTWVTAFDNLDINQYGNFDMTATFPTNKTYRKIRMHYILGRKACPAGTQYCGSWDYTTSVIAMPANKDSVELTRVITPYATDWPLTRTHDYVSDVTDYAILLNGNIDLRFVYEGYSWGFTLTLKFELIEGTPARNVIDIRSIYDNYYSYGNVADPIEAKLTAKTFTLPNNAVSAEIKNIISGHGMDDTGCGEFCSKYYQQKINGSSIAQVQLWKNDCGLNNVYPQTGTWLFDRANWCPGEAVYPIIHRLPSSITGGSTFTADIDMESYSGANQSNLGGYNIASQLFIYGPNLLTNDASIEEVISPSNDPNYKRQNTICSQPIIRVKNNGSNPITALKIKYNLKNSTTSDTYTWYGNLPFNQTAIINLNSNFALFSGNESAIFEVKLIEINGQATDNDETNNRYISPFTHVKSYPNNFKIEFKTNNASDNQNTSINETYWQILDDQGVVVKARTNCANNTKYTDTITLPAGCYTFVMKDGNCDGIAWWYYPNYPINPGTGTLRFIKPYSTGAIKSISGDFGCEYREEFTIDYLLNVEEKDQNDLNFMIFPNPTQDKITIKSDQHFQHLGISIIDANGKKMVTHTGNMNTENEFIVDVSNLNNGIYFIHFESDHKQTKYSTQKLIINR